MANERETRAPKDGEGGNAVKNNGGDDRAPKGAITGAAPLSGKKPDGSVDKAHREVIRANAMRAPEDNGDRESVPAAKLDKVYTADSKDTWNSDQPDFGKLSAERTKINDNIAKKAAKD